MVDRKVIKAAAREQIKGNIWVFFGVSLVLGLISSISGFTFVGPLLLAGPISLGFAYFILEIVRNKAGKFDTAFKGFNFFGESLVAGLVVGICTVLWTLLLIIPGIIAAYRYSMTFYILADNPTMSGTDAVNASKKMMKGHKWELFVLHLSFIGWFFLCGLTMGLLAIYVVPYVHAATANFYEAIKGEKVEELSK